MNKHDEIKKLLRASRNLLSDNNRIQEDFEIKKQYGLISEQEVDINSGGNITKKNKVIESQVEF